MERNLFDAIVTPSACFGAGPWCIRIADANKIWYPLSTYDPMRGWSSRRDLLAGSMARNSACLESACARNGWGMPHENVGWNLRFSTMEFCVLHQEPSTWMLGTSNAALATYWKRTRGTRSNELDNSKYEQFPVMKRYNDWKNVATDADQWMMEMDEFVKFCTK